MATPQPTTTPTNVQATVSSELMVNYIAAAPVAANHPLAAVQDTSGNPILFSISDTNAFYIIFSDPTQPTGWTQYDLSTALPGAPVAQCFGVTQALTGEIRLALAVAASTGGETSMLYVTDWLPNNPTQTDWSNFAPQWQPRALTCSNGADQGLLDGVVVQKILLGPATNATQIPLLVVATAKTNDAEHWFVNANGSDSSWLWTLYPLPENAMSLLDLALGTMSYGPGTYALYETANQATELVFSSTDGFFNRPLTPPAGATTLVTIPDASAPHNSALYVAGEGGVFFYASTAQYANARGHLIPGTDALPLIGQMLVAQDASNASLWVLDRDENLSYLQAQGDLSWQSPSTPLVLQGQVGQMAALRNQARGANELFTVQSNNTLSYQWQDPTTTLWRQGDIPLQDIGQALCFTSYTSHLHFADEKQNPIIGGSVYLTASQWCYVIINGYGYVLDSSHPLTVQSDVNGNVTILVKTSSISTPIFQVSAPFLTAPLTVNPSTGIVTGMQSQIQSGDDFLTQTMQNGQPLVPPGQATQDQLDYAAYGLQQVTQAIQSSLPPDGSLAAAPPPTTTLAMQPQGANALPDSFWGASFRDGTPTFYRGAAVANELVPLLRVHAPSLIVSEFGIVGAIEGVVGDIFSALEAGIEKVAGFVVGVVEEVVQFVLWLGDEVFHIVILCIGQALDLLNWILYTLLGIDLEKILQWLGFIFDWSDIVTTHKVFTNMALQTFEMLQAFAGLAESEIDTLFDWVRSQLQSTFQMPDPVPDASVAAIIQQATQQPTGSEQQGLAFLGNSPGGSFSHYQILHGGILNGPSVGLGSGSQAILTFVQDVLLPTLKEITPEMIAVIQTIVRGYEAGTLTVGQVFELLTGTLLEALLDIAQTVVDGLFSIAQEVLDSIESFLFDTIQIPLLTPLYSLITDGSPMSLVDGFSLLLAIPATISYKLTAGAAPFATSTYGLDTESYQQIFPYLRGKSGTDLLTILAQPRGNSADDLPEGAVIYSQVGGVVFSLSQLVSGYLNATQALSENEVKFIPKVNVGVSLLWVASSFPIESDTTQWALDFMVWGNDLLQLILEAISFLVPRGSKMAYEEVLGGALIIEAVIDVVLYATSFVLEMIEDETSEDRAWDIEKLVQNLLSAGAMGGSGVAGVAGDENPEVALPALAVAAGCNWIACALNVIRIARDISSDLAHQNY